MQRVLIIASAILLGAISAYFISGWLTIIPWAITALFIGYFSPGRKNIIINGALFGYFLFITYIILGYSGKTDMKSLTRFIIFSLVFSLLGAVAGVIGTFIGNLIKRKTSVRHDKK